MNKGNQSRVPMTIILIHIKLLQSFQRGKLEESQFDSFTLKQKIFLKHRGDELRLIQYSQISKNNSPQSVGWWGCQDHYFAVHTDKQK